MFFLILTYLWWPKSEYLMSIFAIEGQIFCQNLFKFTSHHESIYKALACGINPKSTEEYSILKTLSLWHLLVVSGGHLIVLDLLLDFSLDNISKIQKYFFHILGFRKHLCILSHFFQNRFVQLFFQSYIFEQKRFFIKLVSFVGFAFMTGLQAPILRAIFQVIVAKWNQDKKLNLNASEVVLWSGCLCILFFPWLANSLSLQLSWMASLILAHFANRKTILLHTLIYLFVLPILATLQIPHPISIIYNLIFGPVLSLILFPMSLVLIVFPQISFLTDRFVELLLNVLQITAGEFSSIYGQSIIPNDSFLIWIFIIVLNLYFTLTYLKSFKNS